MPVVDAEEVYQAIRAWFVMMSDKDEFIIFRDDDDHMKIDAEISLGFLAQFVAARLRAGGNK